MHSGFPVLRNTFHTNFIARYEGPIAASGSAGAKKEIKRVLTIWDNARAAAASSSAVDDEGFLFGAFSIADAFYWPVLWVYLQFRSL